MGGSSFLFYHSDQFNTSTIHRYICYCAGCSSDFVGTHENFYTIMCGIYYTLCAISNEVNARTGSPIYTYHRDFIMSFPRENLNINVPILIRWYGGEGPSGSGIFGIENNDPMIPNCGSLR